MALARALAARRRVMLLDEPFSALDTGLRTSMYDLLGEVRAALDPTIVIVTHDLHEAGVADRVAVLVNGRIEQFDTIQTLYAAPSTLVIARLVGGFKELPGVVESDVHHLRLGAFAAPPTAHVAGGAILLARKERLALVPPHTPGALTGQIVQVRQAGPYRDVVVELDTVGGDGRARVQVEERIGTALGAGDRVGVLILGPGHLWVIPEPGVRVTPSPHALVKASALSMPGPS